MSNQAEYAVLGCLIEAPHLLPTAVAKISPTDFLDPKGEAVMGALTDLWAKGEPIDAVSVATHLAKARVQVNALEVYELVKVACLPPALDHHLATIADNSAIRKLHAVGQKIVQLAEHESSPHVVAQHAQELLDGATRVDDSQVVSIGEVTSSTFDLIEATARGEVDPGLPTGFIDLDDMIGGLKGGQMVIIAARPGQGKTALAVDFLRNVSIKKGVPSLMLSLEMSKLELSQRILAAESSVRLEDIMKGRVGQDDWARLGNSAERLGSAPLFVDDSTGVTIMDIVSKTRIWVEKNNVGLVVIDYLQLLRAEGVQSREQEVATYSRAMKLLAKQCNIPVVVLSQLNRDSVKHNRPPQVSDLRESGALEQDADMVLLLNRPDASDDDSDRAGEMDVIVGKNRHGRTGTVTLAHQLHYGRFANMVRG